MPNLGMSDQEISDVIAFMDWVSRVDNQGWPPRPILVTGTAIPGADMSLSQQQGGEQAASLPPGARPVSADNDPIALGEALFRTAVPTCQACHSLTPGVNMAGPSLAGLATFFEKIKASGEYTGSATTAEEFVRQSIGEPCGWLHPRPMFSAGGVAFLPPNCGEDRSEGAINHLGACLRSFTGWCSPCETAPTPSPTRASLRQSLSSGCRWCSACCPPPNAGAPTRCRAFFPLSSQKP